MSFIKNNAPVLIVVIVITVWNLMTLNYPGINFEFSFADGANFFLTGNPDLLSRYFTYQANTLALPFISSLILTITPITNPLIAIRLINIVGIILLAVGTTNVCKFLKKQDLIPAIIALTLFNPLIWTFSGRATADFFPMALGIFSISVPLVYRSSLIILVAGCLFGLACAIKYHELCLLVIGITLIYSYDEKSFNKARLLYLFLLPAILVLLLFILIIYLKFDYWIIPKKVSSQHNFRITFDFIDNFFGYLGLLSVLTLPSMILSSNLYKSILNNRKFLFLTLILSAFLYNLEAKDHGELNLGPLDQYVSPEFRFFIYLFMSIFTLATLFSPTKIKTKDINFLSLSILFIVLIFSFARPAQRYLLPLIPFYMIAISTSYLTKKFIVYTSLALFIPAIIFIEDSRLNTANSALEMVRKIDEKKLIDFTNPGVITSHAGNAFKIEKNLNEKYIVVYGERGDALITVQSGSIALTSKTLSLVPMY
jgi:hypothetical protein